LLRSHVVSSIENPMSEAKAPSPGGSPGDRRSEAAIEVKGLEMGYGSYVLMRDIDFSVASWAAAVAERALSSSISSG